MIEFFLFLVVMQVLWFLWAFTRFNRVRQQREEQFEKEATEKVENALAEAESSTTPKEGNFTVVARSVNDVVGTYKDLKIYRNVQLDDGRVFTFESVAVEQMPGVYHADDPSKKYIIVDKYLLYREVPV